MAERDYDVGYGKPPKHSQFIPGQSGNPKGKPRGARGLRSELRAELNEMMTIVENGKARRMPKRRVMLKAMAAKALKGDIRAGEKILQHLVQAEGYEDPQKERDRLSDVDRQIIDYLLSQAGADGIASVFGADPGSAGQRSSSSESAE